MFVLSPFLGIVLVPLQFRVTNLIEVPFDDLKVTVFIVYATTVFGYCGSRRWRVRTIACDHALQL